MPLAAVFVLVVVLILIVVLVIVLILILVLILVLVIHYKILRLCRLGYPKIVCPFTQDLSLALKIKLISNPATIAAVIPPALAFKPPVKIPSTPSLETASLTPLASV